MPKGLQALKYVKIYVKRLKSIVDADTASKVTENANSTLGSIEEIANQLAKENKDGGNNKNIITEYKEPLMGLIEWITERYIERVKKEALAKATFEAHPVISELTEFYATAAQSQKLVEFSGFQNTYVKKQEEFDDNLPTSNSIDAYVLAASNYDVAIKAQAANPLKAFNKAHEKLMKQLNGLDKDQISFSSVTAAIESLEQEAKIIKEMIDSFIKINEE